MTSSLGTADALADNLDENAEVYLVTLNFLANLQAGGSDPVATISITDMDSPPDLFIDDVAFLEGDTGLAVVSLSQISGLDVSFTYESFDTGSATGGGTDYNDIASTTATIPAGSLTYAFDLESVEDPTNEPDETFDVSISALVNAGAGDTDATMTIQNDDGVPQLVLYADTASEGNNVNIMASLSGISGLNITFDWQTFDGTALQASGDYTQVSTTQATIVAGQLTVALPVAALTDAPLDENAETFLVSISNPGNSTIVGATANGTINDVDTEPLIYIDDAVAVNEGETFSFEISLSKISGRDLWFDWNTLDGTALQASADYTQVSATRLTIPEGQGAVTVNVVALTDAPLNEPTESLSVTLSGLTNVTAGDVDATGNINDVDADPFLFIDDITATEGDTSDLIISLSAVSAIPVTASLSYMDGTATTAASDYTNVLVDVSIPAMTRVITLSAFSDEDALNEISESFIMTLSSLSDAQAGDVDALFTITDDDPQPGVYIADAAAVTEGATAQFIVSLGWLSGLDVDFTYNTTDDTAISPNDFTAIGSTTVTIPAGSLQTTISVVTVDELLDDTANSEYFNVTLTAVTNGTISVANGVGQIDDNDAPPALFIRGTSGAEGSVDIVQITLSGPSENNVDFDFSTQDNTAVANGDYQSQTVVGAQIPAGSITYLASITLVADNIYESTELYLVTITSATASVGNFGQLEGITNTTPIPQLFTADAGAITEGATSEFVVTLTNLADTDITFNWSTEDGTATDENTDTDYYEVNAQVATISALSGTVTLSVVTNDDVVAAEGTENYRITLSGGSGNVSIVDGHGQGDINDNEGAINIYIVDDAEPEGTDLVFTVSIDQVSGFNVTYDFNSFDGTALVADGDYTVASGSGTIVAGNTSQTVTVTTGSDTKLENNETLTVSLSNVVGADVAVAGTDDLATGTINNDDGAPNLFIDDLALNEAETLTLMVSLSEVSGLEAVFDWQTYDNSAVQPGDYTQITSTRVTIPAGSLTVSDVSFAALDDDLYEPGELALISLTPVSSVSVVSAGTDDVATVSINNINNTPDVFISDFSLTEPDTVSFIISLSQISGDYARFDYASAPGTALGGGVDFNNFSASFVTIPAGQLNITITGVANAVDDAIAEGVETYQITITNRANINVGKTGATVTINDDEASPGLFITDATDSEGQTLGFVVSLSGASSGDVGFDFETLEGTALFSDSDFTRRDHHQHNSCWRPANHPSGAHDR